MLGVGCSSSHDTKVYEPSFSYSTSNSAPVTNPNPKLNPSARPDHDKEQALAKVRAHIARVEALHKKSNIDVSQRLGSEIQAAGGLQALLKKQLHTLSSQLEELQRTNPSSAELPGLRQSVSRLKELIPTLNICQIPIVLNWGAGELLFPENELVRYVQPGDALTLFGCGFGPHPGSATLKLLNSGQTLPLAVPVDDFATWTSTSAIVNVPNITGVLDQPAEITLTTSANRTTSFGVNFVALRDTAWLDTNDHRNLVQVNPQCFTATTVDSCGGGAPSDDPNNVNYYFQFGADFIGRHLKKCCKSHNGTDIYYVSLTNQWTSADLDPYVSLPLGSNDTQIPATSYIDGGFVSCYFFSHPGHLIGLPQVVSGSGGVTFQVEFSWHVNGICSGESYAAAEILSGPIGFAYW